MIMFIFFFLMIRRPPRSTLFPHDALPISRRRRERCPPDERSAGREDRHPADGAGCRSSRDRKSTRLNSSHSSISYAVFCLKKKKKKKNKGNIKQYSIAALQKFTATSHTST